MQNIVHGHLEARRNVSTAFNLIVKFLPLGSAIIMMVGACQLWVTIWLQVFSNGFDPMLFISGYIAAIGHLILSGLVAHKETRRVRKAFIFIMMSVSFIATIGSVGTVYYLKESNYILLSLINFYAIVVVTGWGCFYIHFFTRVIVRQFPMEESELQIDSIYQGV